ncbi:chitosanase [Lactiplantibacillus garii]|uniref:Chitosanase n=1 Tax=Lactiplantibacillus garii TaxID=2306423 RepID=A0A3R8LJW2_9LACO|nr:chitosanase [Lactiplantibacillus garii]RRK10406.1 chitosanase [Lactiplantibacillus garii]
MRKWWGWLVGLEIILGLGGGYWWYYQHQTIRTGKLRATTFALVSSAENSSLEYRHQYRYVEDIHDGRGYTAGIIGFTSGTGDLLKVVKRYRQLVPRNRLVKYIPALRKVNGTASHRGLGNAFVRDWHQAAKDQRLVRAQDDVVDQMYLRPAVHAAQTDGLGPLGQYIYYDAMVVHGPGHDATSFGGIRQAARRRAQTPARGGTSKTYLRTFLTVRAKVMRQETAHHDLSRLYAQWQFVVAGKDHLQLPLTWKMYGQSFTLTRTRLRQLMR